MSVWWRMTDAEAEELSGILFQHYATANRKKSGKEIAEATLKYWAKLTDRVDARKRNVEPERLHDCTVVFNLNDAEYERLCALQRVMGSEEPEDALSFLVTIGSARFIEERLRMGEKAFPGSGQGEGESG